MIITSHILHGGTLARHGGETAMANFHHQKPYPNTGTRLELEADLESPPLPVVLLPRTVVFKFELCQCVTKQACHNDSDSESPSHGSSNQVDCNELQSCVPGPGA